MKEREIAMIHSYKLSLHCNKMNRQFSWRQTVTLFVIWLILLPIVVSVRKVEHVDGDGDVVIHVPNQEISANERERARPVMKILRNRGNKEAAKAVAKVVTACAVGFSFAYHQCGQADQAARQGDVAGALGHMAVGAGAAIGTATSLPRLISNNMRKIKVIDVQKQAASNGANVIV